MRYTESDQSEPITGRRPRKSNCAGKRRSASASFANCSGLADGTPRSGRSAQLWHPSAHHHLGAFFLGGRSPGRSGLSSPATCPCRNADALIGSRTPTNRTRRCPRVEVIQVGRSSREERTATARQHSGHHRSPHSGARRRLHREARWWISATACKAGQPLAEIEAPELDQQVQQAKANLQQAQAALDQALANLRAGQIQHRTGARHRRTLDAASSAAASSPSRITINIRRNISSRPPPCSRSKKPSPRSAATSPRPKPIVARLENARLPHRESAFRRRDHAAQRGCRRAGQRRQHAAVPHRADRHAAHLRQRAADQRQFDPPGPAGAFERLEPARPRVSPAPWPAPRTRSIPQPHAAGGSAGAQRRRRAAARHVRASGPQQRPHLDPFWSPATL